MTWKPAKIRQQCLNTEYNTSKYKDAKVWDNELRLDLVFGSTGNEKKIHELITELGQLNDDTTV